MTGTVCALVGTVGGAGTTRLSLEFAATLARADREVAVVDAAFGTQGLATAIPGDVGTDVTDAVTDGLPLAEATTPLGLDLPGEVHVAPARAPFEQLARAKTSACARRLAERLSTAADRYDRVFVDVPPVAANPAVAAVTAADRVVLVAPDSAHGRASLPRTRDLLADVDARGDAGVAHFADPDDRDLHEADVAVPDGETTALREAPVSVAPEGFPTAVAVAVETTLGVDLELEEPKQSSLTDSLPL